MITNKSVYSVLAAAMIGGVWANAQVPVVSVINDKAGTSLEAISDNGQWAVGYGKSPINELSHSYPKLYNVKTKETTKLYKSGEENKVDGMMASDVTDDGSIVAGQYNNKAAIWKSATESWTILPVKNRKVIGGVVNAITPDGKYAVGTGYFSGGYNETILMWDLTGEEPVEITPDNLPKPISMCGEKQDYEQLRACDISADGTKFIGLVAYSYMGEDWTFVYDMTTKTWTPIGFEVKENGDGYSFTRNGEGYMFIEGGKFRAGTNEIAGFAYLESDLDGIYTYDIDTNKVTVVEGSDGKLFGGVDRYGLIYASNPSGMPIRDWEVKAGKYWYDFKVLYRQLWNQDWQNDVLQDEYGYTGTFMGVSADGMVLLSNEYTNTPYDSYIIELPDAIANLYTNVNLLSNYAVNPVNNAAFAILKSVQVMFDRKIEVVGDPFDSVIVKDAQGEEFGHSISVAVDPSDSRILTVTFRNRRLDVGEQYTVTIPAGVVCVAGDPEKTNPEISMKYKGRPQAPVAVTSISPESGIEVERINSTSNPITLTFDADISAVEDGGKMYLYLLDDNGGREKIAQLSGSISGNALSVFPTMEQRLGKGSEYEVVIEKNTIADISGADPNEEIVIRYTGSYKPGGDSDNGVLFSDDFNNGITAKWMFYDGDQLEPNSEAASWDFTAATPWWMTRESSETTDWVATSHSMYQKGGKSDDWMVTNQIYVKDNTAVLTFKSQSYRKDATDRLKVYVYATDDVFTALTDKIIDRFKTYGKVVLNEIQSPGASEDQLTGDWKENAISLEEYEGKYIYIAFVNDNYDQSAVFVDDVLVQRDVKYTLSNYTQTSMIAKDEIAINGELSIESETETYKGYTLTLLDGEGSTVATISEPERELKKGDNIEFKFDKALKTPVGKEVKYAIDLKLGDLTEKYEYSVKNLAMATTKRVVIEEFTGQGCPNCPLGHAALDIITKNFGDLVIPMAIHTYTGDNFATPQAQQLTSFLGLSAAPTGRVNRRDVSSPMEIIDKKYYYNGYNLWYDQVADELKNYADADVAIKSAHFDGENYNVNLDVTYALDMDNRNVNIFTVICEDGLQGSQSNNRANEEDPALGDWGKNGIYGYDPVPYVYHDVVRTWAGTTCNGTGGYIPASVVGGQAYNAEISVPNIRRIQDPNNTTVTVMLIDANTGLVVNAARQKVTTSGVEGIEADGYVTAYVENGDVMVKSAGLALVDVYAVDGTLLASQAGEGAFSVDVNGYEGMAIIAVKTADGVKSFKLFVK